MNTLYVAYRRHSIPDIKDGKSQDYLTSEGHELARTSGQGYGLPDMAFHSPFKRAQETIEDYLAGAGYDATSSSMRIESSPLLKTLGISPETMERALTSVPGKKKFDNDAVNWLMDRSHYKPGDETFYDAGTRLYEHLAEVIALAKQEYSGKDMVRAVCISHGPVIEAGYLNILKRAGIEVKQVEEIGGLTTPLEGYEVMVAFDGDETKPVAEVTFRGKTTEFPLKDIAATQSASATLEETVEAETQKEAQHTQEQAGSGNNPAESA